MDQLMQQQQSTTRGMNTGSQTSAFLKAGDPGKIPDITADSSSIRVMLGGISQQITDLAAEIRFVKSEVQGVNSNMQGVFYELEHQQEMIEKTVLVQNKCADQVDLLTCTATKQEKEIETLKQRMEKIETNLLKDNIVISGIEETENEDCVQKVKDFIAVKMEAPEEVKILDAFRIGGGKMRAIRVKLGGNKDKTYIFQHAKNLKGKKNSNEKSFFVQNDLPEKSQEEDRWQRQLFARNKRSVANKLTMSFKRKQLHIQNKQYRKVASTPRQTDLLKMTTEERQQAQTAKLASSKRITEKKNTFLGYAMKTQNISDVRAVYKHLKLKHADATHVTLAYHLIGESPIKSDYLDDGEIGAGRRTVEWLVQDQAESCAIFVVRYHSGQNLGARRFEIIQEIVVELCDLLKLPENVTTS